MRPQRDPVLTDVIDERFPKKTKAVKKRTAKTAESGWNGRFHVMSSKNNDWVHTWGRQYFDAPKEKELINSHMVRSKYANRSINTTTGREWTARPMSSRETGLYGRNKTITDDKGNLRLRGASQKFEDWEKRWQRSYNHFSMHNSVKHPLGRSYFSTSVTPTN